MHFYSFDDVHAFDNFAEDDMLPIEPFRSSSANEKLRPVCVRASIGHRQDPGSGVLQLEVFVLEDLQYHRFFFEYEYLCLLCCVQLVPAQQTGKFPKSQISPGGNISVLSQTENEREPSYREGQKA